MVIDNEYHQPPAIKVRGLRKSYGASLAVAGLDLEVAIGEIFALLGPNGAGKTTALNMIYGAARSGRLPFLSPQLVSRDKWAPVAP